MRHVAVEKTEELREEIMTSIMVKSKVDARGTLNLSIPLGTAEANREVRVIVEPLNQPMSDEQWQQFVRETAGSISDPTFRRHPQGEFKPIWRVAALRSARTTS